MSERIHRTSPGVFYCPQIAVKKPLGFEGKFLDRTHREWEFSSYAETLNQLLSKQIRILEKDHIVVDDAIRKYFFTLCTECRDSFQRMSREVFL